MKIKFKKLEATSAFVKLFGANRDKPDGHSPENGETDDAYEYYYKRGSTYYFRNSAGNKISVDYNKLQGEFVRGEKYKIDAIQDLNS